MSDLATIAPKSVILESAVSKLYDRLDHAASTAKKCLAAAVELDVDPVVRTEDDEYTTITWTTHNPSRGLTVEVLTTWGREQPDPITVVSLQGEWGDDYENVESLSAALIAAQGLRDQVAGLIA